jgi:RHS repeat-associated protein
MVFLTGSGTGSSGTLHQVTDQTAQASSKLFALGGCSFLAIPGQGLGQMSSSASVNDKVWDTTNDSSLVTWVGSGIGDSLGKQTSLSILSPTLYSFGFWDSVSGTITTYNSQLTEDLLWGPGNSEGGASQQNVTMEAGAPVVFGEVQFDNPPLESAQGPGIINAHWKIDWMLAAAPDDHCPECERNDRPAVGSEISPRSQILGEEVDLVGTPFFLHYDSSRVPGHAGIDLLAMKDALNLGGWTLSVHHVFEPLLSNYCAGGACTPYSPVPKAIFFGDGTSRNDADVQASVPLNGNYLLTNEGGSEVYVFNNQGMHLQTLAPLTGAVIYTFAYDSSNRLVSVTDANGNVTSIQRDVNGNPTSITAPHGQKTTLTVDANGFLSAITDPAAHATKLTSSSKGLLLSLTDPKGKVYNYTYDALGMLTKHADPAGGSITLTRTNNSTGYSVLNKTGAGRTSTYAVAFGSTATQTSQASATTWPNGLVANGSQAQQNGQATESATLPNGSSYTKTTGPDPRWGMQVPVVTSESITRGTLTESITQSRTATLATSGDPFSLISQTDTTNVNGRTYGSVFTASTGNLVETSPMGRITTTHLDAQERPTSSQQGTLATTAFTYDSLGRISSIAQGARTTTLSYDAHGNVASTTDPRGLIRSYTYDAAGNMLTATLEDGRVVKYAYDANRNLTSVTPPGGTAHTYSYSPINLPTTYTPPSVTGSGPTTYTYNVDRNVTKVTRPDGAIITNKYDSAGRLASMVTPSATITYGYSATTGNLTKAAVSGGETIAYSYNGSLPSRAAWTGTVSGTVTRAYNNNFWKSSEGVTGGSNISFFYDKDGLLTKAGSLTLARNAATGLYTSGTLGSTKDATAYNTFAEPTSYTAQFGSTVLYGATYTRDKVGRVNAVTETIGGTTTAYTYTFDSAGRLTAVKKAGTAISSYSYDQNSNRTLATTSAGTVNGTYDAQDRLLTYGTASYAYTANGELASKTVGSQVTTYQYDALGNLTTVTLPNGTAISYIIDADSYRVGKEVNGLVVAGFLYDGARLVAQLDASNQVVSQFVYGSRIGSPEYMISGGVTYRIFADYLGSLRLVVNSSTGAIAQRMDYDEFGNVINDTNPGFQPFGFAGGLYDADTKLVRFDTRDYDASTGRWTAKDTERFDGGDTNLYGYVLNDPVNLVDPSGTEGTCPCKKSDAPRRDQEPDYQADKAGEHTLKNDPKTAKGPELPKNPNTDRLGITKAPSNSANSGEGISNPLQVDTNHNITVTPLSVGGKIPAIDGNVTISIPVSLDRSRTITVKDGARNHMTLPFPFEATVGLQCEFTWGGSDK